MGENRIGDGLLIAGVTGFIGWMWNALGIPCVNRKILAWLRKMRPVHHFLMWINALRRKV